jgi:hypothetical protein
MDRDYALWAELERRMAERPELERDVTEAIKRGLLPERPTASVDDVVRGTARGVPGIGGGMDEVAAAADALVGRGADTGSFSGNVEANVKDQRAKDDWFDTAYPNLSMGAKLGGGALSGAAVYRAAPEVASQLFGGGGRSMVSNALRGGGSGAVLSGVHGFTEGEGGPGQRGENAAESALWGTVIGAALPILTAGPSKLYDWISPPVSKTSAGRSAFRVDNALKADGGKVPASGPMVNAGQSTEALAASAAENPGGAANLLRGKLDEGIPDIRPSIAARLKKTTAGAAKKEADISFGKRAVSDVPGLLEAGVNLFTLKGLAPGTAIKDVLRALGNKMAQGRFDDDSFATLQLLLKSAPEAADEIAETMASMAKQDATRDAIRTVVRSMAVTTTPAIAAGGGGGGGL